jgi:hypothetical protein
MLSQTDPAGAGLDLRGLTTALAGLGTGLSDAERIDTIRAAEDLICAAQALQARLSRDLDTSVRSAAADRGVPAARRGRGIAHQIALARRESPHRAERRLQLAKIAPDELPHTMAAWTAGRVDEYRVTLVARETACLSLADRLRIDAELAADPTVIETMGISELVAQVRRRAYALDPEAFVERRRRAEADRHTTLRPAPDTLSRPPHPPDTPTPRSRPDPPRHPRPDRGGDPAPYPTSCSPPTTTGPRPRSSRLRRPAPESG